MTSEICVMNRFAVVLAADSATTVTRWTPNGAEQRYFKGANKIFQLSDHHPVGLMIYDSADLLSVPWEIIVKSFRKALGSKSFNSLDGYADEFSSFLERSLDLFPEKVQTESLLEAAESAALQLASELNRNDPPSDDAAYRKMIQDLTLELDGEPFAGPFTEETLNDVLSLHQSALKASLEEYRDSINLPGDLDEITAFAFAMILKHPDMYFGATGIVIAGFGDHDVFPAMIELQSGGLIVGRHLVRESSRVRLDHETPAWLKAFAQTSMSDTFSLGLSSDAYTSLMIAAVDGIRQFAEDLCGVASVDHIQLKSEIDRLVDETRKSIGDKVMARARQEHAFPLRSVIGVLPVDEMAELAETLINLQSLKEKVTMPSQTVGGPVDIAVITRSEGLVWIKRKHFFDPAINSRYMQRQAAAYQ